MIQFHANRRSAFCVSDDRLTTGSVGLETVFRFSEDWEAAPARVAVFRGSGRSVDVLLTGDCCSVPPEVLTEAGDVLSIGVYGTDGNGSLVIPTVYDEAGTIERGAEPSGLEPDEQTQPLIDQLVTAAQAARSRADYALLFAQTLNAGDDIPLDVAWERGGMSSDGADNNTQTYCCRTVGRIGSSAGLAIRAADGFRFFPARFDAPTGGNRIAGSTAWVSQATIPAGQYWRVCVEASPEDTSMEADPAVFGAAIRIRNNIGSGGGGGVTVDDALSGSSANPVQNKVVKAALDGKYARPAAGIPASDLAPGVIPTVPANVGAFTNDAGYLTLATLPVYTGGVS